MSSNTRKLTYSLAINEALLQTMENDKSVFLIGQGVKSPWYVGNTAGGLLKRFGHSRVIDTPVSENAMTGAAVGAAIAGMRAIVVHPRMDFMLYAFDPIINEAANWFYMNGGRRSVPVVIWAIINRKGEQAAQHSQALQAMFMHVPGLKIVIPSTPYDAKGLMISSVRDNNPVIFIDDRCLYNIKGDVPKIPYEVPIGEGVVVRKGRDITIAATSYMVHESLKASDKLKKTGVYPEVLDLRSIKPLDVNLIYKSVRKTGRLVIADGGWKTCGVAAEISALVNENLFGALRAPVARVTLPDIPAPASLSLENAYYPDEIRIVETVNNLMKNNGGT